MNYTPFNYPYTNNHPISNNPLSKPQSILPIITQTNVSLILSTHSTHHHHTHHTNLHHSVIQTQPPPQQQQTDQSCLPPTDTTISFSQPLNIDNLLVGSQLQASANHVWASFIHFSIFSSIGFLFIVLRFFIFLLFKKFFIHLLFFPLIHFSLFHISTVIPSIFHSSIRLLFIPPFIFSFSILPSLYPTGRQWSS